MYTYHRPQPTWTLQRSCGCCLASLALFMITLAVMCGGSLLLYTVDPPPAQTILIIGVDTRPDSAEPINIARTDSLMLLRIDPANKRLVLLSIPRDLRFSTPTFGMLPINTVIRNAELNQSGTGIAELTATLENTLRIQIDHYVRVDFTTFVEIIDAVGGVDIDVPKAIVDNAYPTDNGGTMRVAFDAGKQHMDGATALIYARTRHADDDYQRAGRQQQVLNATLHKFINPLNGWRAWRVLDRKTETDLSTSQLLGLAPGLALYQGQVEQLVIDRDLIIIDSDTAVPDLNKIRPWTETYLGGTP